MKFDRNIVIIGFDNSSIGEILAKELSVAFVDSKSLTLNSETMQISELEQLYKKTKEWLKHTKNSIIALEHQIATTDEISKLGFIIYLKNRLTPNIDRDELNILNEIFTEKADYILDTTNLSKDEVIKELLWIDFENI